MRDVQIPGPAGRVCKPHRGSAHTSAARDRCIWRVYMRRLLPRTRHIPAIMLRRCEYSKHANTICAEDNRSCRPKPLPATVLPSQHESLAHRLLASREAGAYLGRYLGHLLGDRSGARKIAPCLPSMCSASAGRDSEGASETFTPDFCSSWTMPPLGTVPIAFALYAQVPTPKRSLNIHERRAIRAQELRNRDSTSLRR